MCYNTYYTKSTIMEPIKTIEPTSPELVELNKQAAELAGAWQKTKYGTKEYNDAKAAMLAQEKLIDAEIKNIAKLAAEQKLADLRNERIAVRTNYKTAVLANVGKGANAETAAAELAAETELDNLLLPVHKSAPAAKTSGGTRGATTQQIYDELNSRISGGMDATAAVKEVIALGFSRGTVGSVRTEHWPVQK